MIRQKAILGVAIILFAVAARADSPQQQYNWRQWYAKVNKSLPSAKVRKFDIHGKSTEGGQLTAYLNQGQAQKLNAMYYGEMGRSSEEYYFWRGQLFFVLRNDWAYEKHIMHGGPGKEKLTQERFYFQNGKLARWVNFEGKVQDLTTTAALRAGKDFTDQAREYLGWVKAGKAPQ